MRKTLTAIFLLMILAGAMAADYHYNSEKPGIERIRHYGPKDCEAEICRYVMWEVSMVFFVRIAHSIECDELKCYPVWNDYFPTSADRKEGPGFGAVF